MKRETRKCDALFLPGVAFSFLSGHFHYLWEDGKGIWEKGLQEDVLE